MIEAIKVRGVLQVGVRTTDRRFVTRQDGDYHGFDVEIARSLGAHLGLQPDQVRPRWLPDTARVNSVLSGDVDLLLGDVEPGKSVVTVGPYAVTENPAEQHYIAIKPGDEIFRAELDKAVQATVASGQWQRAYDQNLAPQGIAARPR